MTDAKFQKIKKLTEELITELEPSNDGPVEEYISLYDMVHSHNSNYLKTYTALCFLRDNNF